MEFKRHALRRMRLRRVEMAEVAEALLHHEETRVSSEYPDRLIVFGTTAGGRRLKIVLTVDEQVVITVSVQGRRR